MMGRWFQEEVAGDRYIFDSAKNPVVLGCPQGAPVFVIVGEEERAARRACDAHNAMVSDRDRYRHRAMEAEHLISTLTAERDALARRINPDGAPVDVASLCLEIDEATAERDELRGKLAEYESECYALRAVTAEKNSDILRKRVKARDVVITKLLAMLKPAAGDTECPAYTLHARACEIAGRTE